MSETGIVKSAVSKSRLHSICPYYAMFPDTFAKSCILEYSNKNDIVLDPYCGRGTTPLEALLNNRISIASDINPVAYIISKAKTNIPRLHNVMNKIDSLENNYSISKNIEDELNQLPIFFDYAYHKDTLKQILYLKTKLNWKYSKVEMFIMALLLGGLHGEITQKYGFLSNQMPHTISPKPNYSVNYWKNRNLTAPYKNVFHLMRYRAQYRLQTHIPGNSADIRNSDIRKLDAKFKKYLNKVSLILTSPPYFNVTNFEEDQWLRLWLLGGPPKPTYGRISKDDRYLKEEEYFQFLTHGWLGVRNLARDGAILIIRIGTKHISVDEMTHSLSSSIFTVWKNSRIIKGPISTNIIERKRQTNLFRPGAEGCRFELDYIFELTK